MDPTPVAKTPAKPVQLVEHVPFMERMSQVPLKARIAFGVGVLALAGIVASLAIGSGRADLKPLYTNLSDKDAGAIVAQLAQQNVPYQLGGAGMILVPAAQIPDLRLKLATAGLPKGTVSGFELMDSARFGQTQFQERLTFQRGLEGELTRSIGSLAAVQGARVHLALPNQNGFFREQQKPSASVLLTLFPGRTLDRAQIAGIVHLVSSSVPELDPKAVSVLDQSGALLTDRDERGGSLDAQQLQYVAQIESGYARRIYELLEPVVGRDNLRASVTAEVDFSQSEATSEEFRPNQGSDASISIRSQQTSESNAANAAQPSGVPGAQSNQPPVAATAPLAGASQPLQGAPAGGAGGNGRRDVVTNYEVDKTVRVTRNATGSVRRLNAAVVVNHRTVEGSGGKKTATPLAADEIEKLTALVRESIGFKADRGDSVKVINAPFKVDKIDMQQTPWWRDPAVLDIARGAATPLALAAVALLVLFGLVRPAFKAYAAARPPLPAPGANLDAIEADKPDLPSLPAPDTRSINQLERARQLARDNPAAVAGILRTWVSGDGTPAPAR